MVTAAKADVVVIGGGPAGLAAAIAARGAGLDVHVIDRGVFPIDKACGEGLMPDGVAALRRLGVGLCGGDGLPFRGIRFLDRHHVAEAAFPSDMGVGIRRTRLHRLLVEHAQSIGVAISWNMKATAIDSSGVWIDENLLECKWIIGADGFHSQTRRWAGWGSPQESESRVGLRQHFRISPWTDFVEVHWCDGGQAYVTPVGANEVCVALLGRAQEVSFSDLATWFPRLAARLEAKSGETTMRGAFTGTQRLRQVTRRNVALVGDASSAIDAITGDGLALAFRQAEALGAALREGDLSFYETRHRQICRTPFLMARLLLLMDRHGGLRKFTLEALAGRPGIFDKLLAAHVGARHPVVASMDIAALGLRLLARTATSWSGSATP